VQRFRKFIGQAIDFSRLREDQLYISSGVTVRYLPDEIELFEELEFGLGKWRDQEVVFTIVVEDGKLARISLGYIPLDASEDDMRAFTEQQLETLLNEKGGALERFLKALMQHSRCP
jgi:hypothetical protein